MTKTTMPTRTAFSVDGSLFWEGEHRHGESCDLITTAQAETYANERVRKAMEEAAALCDRFAERDMHPAECAGAIRCLIPKETT